MNREITNAILLTHSGKANFKLILLMAIITSSVLIFSALECLGEDCSWCTVDYCRTTYPADNDGDGDGMNDDYEMQLARTFKPRLYFDQQNSEIPWKIPNDYETPYEAVEACCFEDFCDYICHTQPADVIQDGTVYVHVRPFGVAAPGRAHYIEIAYWFYFPYNESECTNGNCADHGHDWEHIALCLAEGPDDDVLQVVAVIFTHHKDWEIKEQSELEWTSTPGLSSVKTYIVDGSHASYPSVGERCAEWDGECVCHEDANGQKELEIDDQKIMNLYELGDQRAPKWLGYSDRWPGHTSYCWFHYIRPPHGPAQGTEEPKDGGHAYWWNNGHFYYFPWCIRTNLESVPEPDNFVVSNYKHDQPIDNALYLTWNDPTSGSEDGFVLMRKPYDGYGNGWDTTGYTCLAQLQSSVHEYTDTCLDGGTGWWYKLETYRNNPDPLYRGCSIPLVSVKDGWVTGDLCPSSLVPARPRLISCDNCVLHWEDRSTNEDGFHIWFGGSIVGTVGANASSFNVSDCNTGKFGYRLSAYNQYGETYAIASVPCNGGTDGCPFIYTWDGSDYVKDNNLLEASEDSTLTKVNMSGFYLLSQPLVPQTNQYKLQIREFEREHSFFDYLTLITLDHPADKKIALTPSGKPYAYSNPKPPVTCIDNRGLDCSTQIAEQDTLYYRNDQPGFMVVNFGVLSNVTGLFKPLTDGGGGGVPEPPKEDTPNKLTPLTSTVSGNVLTVEVFQDSIWLPLGKLYPHSKPGLRLIELASFIKLQADLKLKLSWTRRYSANQIAFYDLESSSLVLHMLDLSSAVNLSSGDAKTTLSVMDNSFAELKPAETIDLAFPYVPIDSNMQRDFIVAAKGYYYSEDYVDYSTQWSSDTTTSLLQNYPNPFNPETQIEFVLPKQARVKLEVYNLLGQKVVTLIDREMPAGPNTIVWDGKNETGENVSSGIYFYRLEAGDLKKTKKMVIVR